MGAVPLITAAAALTAAAFAACAEDALRGSAEALSGDRIELTDRFGRSMELRLAGLSAPPPGQLCPGAEEGSVWECGEGSRAALAAMVRGEETVCRPAPGFDEGPGPQAECFVQTRNLNLWMLRAGRAVLRPEARGADPEYGRAEESARRIGAMLWAGGRSP